MADVLARNRVVFSAPTKNRTYLTARAAAKAEASAMLAKKYPTEKPEYDATGGMSYDPGYHWSSDERLLRVHTRLTKRLLRITRAAAAIATQQEGQKS